MSAKLGSDVPCEACGRPAERHLPLAKHRGERARMRTADGRMIGGEDVALCFADYQQVRRNLAREPRVPTTRLLERVDHRVLTAEQVAELRRLYDPEAARRRGPDVWTVSRLAKLFGVGETTIRWHLRAGYAADPPRKEGEPRKRPEQRAGNGDDEEAE